MSEQRPSTAIVPAAPEADSSRMGAVSVEEQLDQARRELHLAQQKLNQLQRQIGNGAKPQQRHAEESEGDEEKQKDEKAEDKEQSDQKSDEKKKAAQGERKPAKKPFYKRPVPLIIIGAILLIGIIGGALWWLHARQYESTDDAFIDGHSVPISPNVAATVTKVLVNDNQKVKAGDLLVELDPRDYQAVVNQMQAALAAAQAQLAQAQAQGAAAQAKSKEDQAAIDVAMANADNAAKEYKRISSLSAEARSQQQLDNAIAANQTAQAQLEQARAKYQAGQANISNAEAAVKTAQASVGRAQADLQQANINLAYTQIRAPEDGWITNKNVEAGAYVNKGQLMLALVPPRMWVTANFKETQLVNMQVGQPVTISVDAYPHHDFRGRVDSIQRGTGSHFSLLPPENATGNYVKIVQRVPVKITFDDDELENAPPLGLGMSVTPKVKVK